MTDTSSDSSGDEEKYFEEEKEGNSNGSGSKVVGVGESTSKRKAEAGAAEDDPPPPVVDEEEEDEFIGPQPILDEPQAKKRKYLPNEKLFLDNMPCAEYYEKSFMHRDLISHIAVSKTDFIITASCDGHIKFWKKQEEGIEFVKHFRSHLGNIQAIAVNHQGTLLSSISNDKSLKIFDVINFDMINMMKLNFIPKTCEWIHTSGDPISAIALSEEDSNKIYVFDGNGTSEPMKILENIHQNSVTIIKYNPIFDTVISVDEKGMIEYWSGPNNDYKFPSEPRIYFDSKLDTDLFEFVQKKVNVLSMAISPNGLLFACYTSNRKINIFKFKTGKLFRIFDENINSVIELQNKKQLIPQMEFGRRMAVEREIEKTETLKNSSLVFDESSNFLLYPTVIGVKIVNIVTNRLARLLGKSENVRILQIALFQGKVKKLSAAAITAELEASDNPTIDNILPDPTLFCTAFKKNRFYLFSRRDALSGGNEKDRDVFNEKPSKEDIIASTDTTSGQRIFDNAVIHTTKGDIHLKLFSAECPKAVENFCVHAKNGYYNGHIFHRVIKGFMIQTGDPQGIGTGGESIWGGEFEDEFHPSLKHDRPYTVSMANAGKNTNGSQFFITVIPTPWLDNKHTVFGRAVRGMETIQNISLVKTHPKTDKPYDDVSIINITVR